MLLPYRINFGRRLFSGTVHHFCISGTLTKKIAFEKKLNKKPIRPLYFGKNVKYKDNAFLDIEIRLRL